VACGLETDRVRALRDAGITVLSWEPGGALCLAGNRKLN
jgi:hypothetical protein